ncbi:helix-turn-helix domain-containing protein [Paenibacillus riograndensis]|uniref:helix-turn-helix domain-containing protein n=1 Tax=Paenibacillus riograndensis TaxID=483937 RepID=UPI0009E59747
MENAFRLRLTEFHPLPAEEGDFSQKAVKKVLKDCYGNGTEAAKKLSVDRSVIYRKLKKMEEVLRN